MPESPSGDGGDPASQGGQDTEPRRQQGGASRPQRELAADSKIWRKEWKRESDYSCRGLAGTQAFRFSLQTRQIENQFKELMIKGATLNRMAHLGMLDSVKVAG